MKSYIGMDAHGRTSTFVVLDEKGSEILHHRIETSELKIREFLKKIPKPRSLVFEEMYLSKWLYGFLETEVEEILVCNPSLVIKRNGPKNDYLDAKHLAQLLRGGFLSSVYHENNSFTKFRPVISGYNSLVRDMTRLKNRYKLIFLSKGIKAKGYHFNRNPLNLDKLKCPYDYFIAEKIHLQLKHFEEQKKTYLKLFKQNTYENKGIMALTTIPGISYVRANAIAATVVTPKRFSSKYKYWSYCMLVRHDKNSDGKSYGLKYARGRKDLKAIYLGAAESVIIHGKETALYHYYEEQINKGKHPRTAKRNLARKIASISLAVLESEKSYRDKEILDEKRLASAEA